jgi:hypothetical protein
MLEFRQRKKRSLPPKSTRGCEHPSPFLVWWVLLKSWTLSGCKIHFLLFKNVECKSQESYQHSQRQRKTRPSHKQDREQGDRIGRIFAHRAIVLKNIFFVIIIFSSITHNDNAY